MSDNLLTPDNLSKEMLRSICDAAYMDVLDVGGDLKVKDRVTCWIFPNMERKDRINLMSLFAFKPDATQLQRLEVVNRINNSYAIVKASVADNDALQFSYDILIGGGITKKAFILAVKRFCSIPHDAIADCAQGVVL